MRQSTIVIPFSLVPAEHARDLLREARAPSLAQCLSHASRVQQTVSDPFAPLLPHEQWLVGQPGDNSPAIAHALMQQLDLPPSPGYWFVLEPAHFHVARDHLVLTDRRQLNLSESTSKTLFDAAHPLFAELGYTLRYGDARHWFLRADAWSGLRSCSPDAACGHNIDVWLPRGPGERDWRRLHNEVQMLWHTHEINEARELRGERRINALWLWGGSNQFDDAATDAPGLRALARCYLGSSHDASGSSPLLLDALTGPALAGDWTDWIRSLAELDADQLAPALVRLREGQISELRLVLTGGTLAIEWKLTRASMRKFWVRASLARLAP